jgi:hypothetical protein
MQVVMLHKQSAEKIAETGYYDEIGSLAPVSEPPKCQ